MARFLKYINEYNVPKRITMGLKCVDNVRPENIRKTKLNINFEGRRAQETPGRADAVKKNC